MFTKKNSGQPLNQNNLMHSKQTKDNRAMRFAAIPKPIKQKQNDASFSNTINYQIHNNYFIKADTNIINVPYDIRTNNRYKVKKIVLEENDNVIESYPKIETEKYKYNDGVIVYQKKYSNTGNYRNNNSVYFTNPNNNNEKKINNNEKKINNNKNNNKNNNPNNPSNPSNYGFKESRGTAPEKRQLRYNYSSKTLSRNKDKDFYNQKENNNELKREYHNNYNTNNYQFVNIKYKSNQNKQNNNFHMKTPNNTGMHTIIYTNGQDAPIPKKLFDDNVKRENGQVINKKQRNIPEEINNYFYKRKINYKDRNKYINAALFIQTTYRNYKKKGKIQFNFIKRYVKLYRAIGAIEGILNKKEQYWKYFKDKLIFFIENSNPYIKKKTSDKMNKTINKKRNSNSRIVYNQKEVSDTDSKSKTMVRYHSRDVLNIEKLLKEKEDLEKRLNQIMEENSKINLSNKDLLFKNLELAEKLDKTKEKTKKLEMENEKYLSEYSKTKDKYSKIETEVADVNMKLKITHLKFILEKKEKKNKLILKKYFKKFKEICHKLKDLETKNKNKNTIPNNNTNNTKNKYLIQIEERKKNEERIKKRNKILLELIYNKEKERILFMHSCFSKFYYKGMINQLNFRKSLMLDQLHKKKSKSQQDEKIKEEEKKKQEEEERQRKEEEERQRKEEEEERKKKEEEERKKKEEEEQKNDQEKKKMNKMNMERRKKLKRLLQDEKKQKLELKREYFKRFHFRAIFLSHFMNKKQENKISTNNDDDNKGEIVNALKEKEKEEELKLQKEREEMIQNRKQKLETLFFKKDRKMIILKKNIMQRWNLTAKLISLGPMKKIRGRSKKRGDSKKRGVSKKGKSKDKIKKKNKEGENENKSEDEKDKDDEKDKEDEKEIEK